MLTEMKRFYYLSVLCCTLLIVAASAARGQKVAIYSYPVEIELTNDQGDMPTKEYLRNYGTKGKKRGNEFIYQAVTPFLLDRLLKSGLELLPIDTLTTLKANEYGKPSATIGKAVATGLADRYLRVHLKDITMPVVADLNQQDPGAPSRKIVKMQCRMQLLDGKKDMVWDVSAEFQSGEKIENASELGVDLRKYQGSDYLQELKIYETCTKMAIIRALDKVKKS
jgi:hypothetical protein